MLTVSIRELRSDEEERGADENDRHPYKSWQIWSKKCAELTDPFATAQEPGADAGRHVVEGRRGARAGEEAPIPRLRREQRAVGLHLALDHR